MYVDFLSSDLADRPICLTSDIGRIVVSTDAPSIRISLSAQGQEFYSAVLYAYGGKVTVDDLASVIELYFISLGWHTHSVSFRAEASDDPSVSDSMMINCLFCSYSLPEDFDPATTFFSCQQPQRVPPSAIISLYGQIPANQTVRLGISGFNSSGSPKACQIMATSYNGYVIVDIPSIINQCKSVYAMERVAAVSVFCVNVSKTLFVCDMPDFLEFRFRNCFNCPESVFVSGASVMKTEVARDMAVCAGQAQHYNHLTTRSYEHTTTPLTRTEAAAISQLIESRSVSVMADGIEYQVIITDNTSEVSNDDASLNTLKFTWRFTGKRPRLFGETLKPLTENSGIFTEQFTDPFQ